MCICDHVPLRLKFTGWWLPADKDPAVHGKICHARVREWRIKFTSPVVLYMLLFFKIREYVRNEIFCPASFISAYIMTISGAFDPNMTVLYI